MRHFTDILDSLFGYIGVKCVLSLIGNFGALIAVTGMSKNMSLDSEF
jgi:hypothetical protein